MHNLVCSEPWSNRMAAPRTWLARAETRAFAWLRHWRSTEALPLTAAKLSGRVFHADVHILMVSCLSGERSSQVYTIHMYTHSSSFAHAFNASVQRAALLEAAEHVNRFISTVDYR